MGRAKWKKENKMKKASADATPAAADGTAAAGAGAAGAAGAAVEQPPEGLDAM